MMIILLKLLFFTISLLIAVKTVMYGVWCFKSENKKAGGIVVVLMGCVNVFCGIFGFLQLR